MVTMYPQHSSSKHILDFLLPESLLKIREANLPESLRLICKTATYLVGITHAAVVLFDRNYLKGTIVAEYPPEMQMESQSFDIQSVPLEKSLIEDQVSVYIPDVKEDTSLGEAKDRLVKANVNSMLILPLIQDGRVIGSLGLDNCNDAREFSDQDITKLTVLVEQCAKVVAQMQRAQQLEQLHQAQAIAVSSQTRDASLLAIIQSAVKAFDADYAFIWPCDPTTLLFEPDKLLGVNLPKLIRNAKPNTTAMITKLLDRELWEASKVEDVLQGFSPRTQKYMRELEIKSFQAIHLSLNKMVFGVMAVCYKHERNFYEADRQRFKEFAYYAGQVLQRAYTHSLLDKKQQETQIISSLAASGDFQTTLSHTVEVIKRNINSDIVTLYVYNPDLHVFTHKAGIGISEEKNLCEPQIASHRSKALRHFINLKKLYYISNNPYKNKWLSGDFTKAEKLQGTMVFPVRFEQKNIGVLFINYRKYHNFSKQEILDVLYYINLVAPAVRNAQLSEEKAKWLRGIHEAGKAIVSAHSLEDKLRLIVTQALELIGLGDDQDQCVCYVGLFQHGQWEFPAASNQKALELLEKQAEYDGLIAGSTPQGVSGQAILLNAPQIVKDVSEDKRYMRVIPKTRSQISLPLNVYGQTIGVLNLEHQAVAFLNEYHVEILTLLADQAAIAIEQGRQKIAIEQMQSSIATISEYGDPQTALQTILDITVKALRADAGLLYPYDQQVDEFQFDMSVGSNLPGDFWEAHPRMWQTSRKVILEGYTCISDFENDFNLPEVARNFLSSYHFQALQGMVIKNKSGQIIGVLFVIYKIAKDCNLELKNSLITFGQQIGLLLEQREQTARLVRLRKANQHIADIIANPDKNLNVLLSKIAQCAHEALRSHVTTIYVANSEKQKIFAVGAKGLDATDQNPAQIELDSDNSIWRIMNLPSHQLCEQGIRPDDALLTGKFAKKHHLQAAIGVPLRYQDMTLGVLFVNYRSKHIFSLEEIEDVLQFSNLVVAAVNNSINLHKISRLKTEMENFKGANINISAQDRLQKIVEIAHKNFEANSVVLYTYDAQHGRFADVYHFGCQDARNIRHPQFLNKKDPIIGTAPWKVLQNITRGQGKFCAKDAQSNEVFKGAFVRNEHIQAVMAAPLYAEDERVGVMLVNYQHPFRFFSQTKIEAFIDFTKYVAQAVQASRTQIDRETEAKINQAILDIRNQHTKGGRKNAILDKLTKLALNLIGETTDTSNALSHFSIVTNNTLEFVACSNSVDLENLKHTLGEIDLDRTDCPIGIVGRAAKTNTVIFAEHASEHADWLKFSEKMNCVVAIPISLHMAGEITKNVYGVLVVGHSEINKISVEQQRALEKLAEIASEEIYKASLHDRKHRREVSRNAVWDKARRIQHDDDIQDLLSDIIIAIAKEFGADAGAIYPYDKQTDEFFWNEMQVYGVDKEELLKTHPRKGEISRKALVEGYITIEDIAGSEFSPVVKKFFNDCGFCAAHCSVLRSPLDSQEPCYGTVLLFFRQPHKLVDKDVTILKEMAEESAKILSHARKYAQVYRLQQLASQIDISDDESFNLKAKRILEGVKGISGADLVNLHLLDSDLDEESERFTQHIHVGDYKTEHQPVQVHLSGSLLWRFVNHPDPYLAIDDVNDEKYTALLQGRYVKAQDIKSVFVTRLYSENRIMGVLFLNYKTQQHFYREEIDDYCLVAKQAAIVLANELRYEEQTQSRALYEGLNEAVQSSLNLSATATKLSKIAEEAYQSISDAEGVCYIAFRHKDKWGFVATYPVAALNYFQTSIGEVELIGNHRKGIVGEVFLGGQVKNLADVTNEPSYLQYRNMKSQLSVPVYGADNNVIAVLSVESPRYAAFDVKDEQSLTLLSKKVSDVFVEQKFSGVSDDIDTTNDDILTTPEPESQLREMLNNACHKLGAWSGLVHLETSLHELGPPIQSIGFHKPIKGARPNGISYKVYRGGKPIYIPDTSNTLHELNPAIAKDEIKAMACIPIIYKRRAIGVLWLRFKETRTFSKANRELFQFFANQIASTYYRVKTERAKEVIRIAKGAVSQVSDTSDILKRLVEHTKRIHQAHAASFLPYDPLLGKFMFDQVVPRDALRLYIDDSEAGTTSKKVIELGEIECQNVDTDNSIRPLMKTHLLAHGIRAFYGIPLFVKDQHYGVIYVDFDEPRRLSGEEKQQFKDFAVYTAITFHNASLREKEQELVELAIKGDTRTVLEKLVDQARLGVGCQISAIYVFDDKQEKFIDRMISVGVSTHFFQAPDKLTNRSAAIWRILLGSAPYCLADAEREHEFLLKSSFVRDANVKAVLAIALRSNEQNFGVMFFSFRDEHTFTQEEINDALRYAEQAAKVIQQFIETKKNQQKLKTTEALAWLGAGNNIWRHQITAQASNITKVVDLMEQDLRQTGIITLENLRRYFKDIRDFSKAIHDERVVPPLSIEQGIGNFSLTELIRERYLKFQKNKVYSPFKLNLDESLTQHFYIKASVHWIQIAFDIFIKNAYESLETVDLTRRQISVSAHQHKDKVEIRVMDTGIGIKPEIKAKLFKEQVTTKTNKGLGMGLLLAQQIIELYGGYVVCEDNQPHGTMIKIWLPYTANGE